jgi:hypothetical protein
MYPGVASLRPMLARRQMLTASAAIPAVIVTLGATGCQPIDAALGRTPPLSRDVRALQAAIATEQNLIDLYARTVSAYSVLGSMLGPLLAEHREHLSRLAALISYPQGYRSPAASPSPHPAALSPTPRTALAALESAETAAAAAQTGRLAGVSPSIAQLLASVAASEITHAATLAGPS